ncbi:MAG TPA: hypothetical protein VFH54_09715, partial [Mycobacteriales bacterium]|nr:hypothetical protein [Mycobacteriales bacterium]
MARWQPLTWPGVPAYLALGIGTSLLLCIGATAAALHGRMSGGDVAVACAVVVVAAGVASTPAAIVALSLIGWMTAASFVRPPYGALHPTPGQAELSAVVLAGAATAGTVASFARLRLARRRSGTTLVDVGRLTGLVSAVDVRRRVLGLVLAAVLLPAL